jgi:hypothetical protein
MIPRKTVIEQMAWYAEIIERESTYYGNEEQFWKRHNEIVNWLKSLYEK